MSTKLKIFNANPLYGNTNDFWNAIVVNELMKNGYEIYSTDNTQSNNIFLKNTKELLDCNVLLVNLNKLQDYPEIASYCGMFWTMKTQCNDLHYKTIIGYYSNPINNYVTELISDIGKIIKVNIPKDILDNDTEFYRAEAHKINNLISTLI